MTTSLNVAGAARERGPASRAWSTFPRRSSGNASTHATPRPGGDLERCLPKGLRRLTGLAVALAMAGACTGAPAGSSETPATAGPAGSNGPAATTAGPGAAGSPPASVAATGARATPTASPAEPFRLGFPAFSNGGAIPAYFTCSGADVSPPLTWSQPSSSIAAYALVVVDTDAAGFVHWVVSDIPGDRSALVAGERVGVAGRNSFGGVGYGGPCPPVGSGVHHYLFTLYSLSHRLGLGGVPTAAQVRAAAAKVTLAIARLTATYLR